MRKGLNMVKQIQRTHRCDLERLESREVFAADMQIELVGSELVVHGTEQIDEIHVLQRNEADELSLVARSGATAAEISTKEWTSHTWPASLVRSIRMRLGSGDDLASVIASDVARSRLAVMISGGSGDDRLSYRGNGDIGSQASLWVMIDGGSGDDEIVGDFQGAFRGSVQVVMRGAEGNDALQLSLLRESSSRCAGFSLLGDQGDDHFTVDFGASDGVVGEPADRQVSVHGGSGQDSLVGPEDLLHWRVENVRHNHTWQTLLDGIVKPYLDEMPELNLFVGLHTSTGGREMYSYGRQETATAERVSPLSEFEIGSITKTFTATALAELVRRGVVQLDDPVRMYLPEGAIVPMRGSHEITLEELATHRSGLPSETPQMERLTAIVIADAEQGIVDEQHISDLLTAEALRDWPQLQQDLLEIQLDDVETPEPSYSNLGFGLLGFALSNHLGMSYEAMIRSLVLVPLGLGDTYQAFDDARQARFAQGYFESDFPVPPLEFDTLAGAGALRASGIDLLRYLEAQLDPSYSSLASTIGLTQTPRSLGPQEFADESVSMGLGWLVAETPVGQIVTHDGATFGFQSALVASTETQSGFVMMVNSRDERLEPLMQTLRTVLFNELFVIAGDVPSIGDEAPEVAFDWRTQTVSIEGTQADDQIRVLHDEATGELTVSSWSPSSDQWTDRRYAFDLVTRLDVNLDSGDDEFEFATKGNVSRRMHVRVDGGEGDDAVRLELGSDGGELRGKIHADVDLGDGDDGFGVRAFNHQRGSRLHIDARLGAGNDGSQLELQNPSVSRAVIHAAVFGEAGDDEIYGLALDDLARGSRVSFRADGGVGDDTLALDARGQMHGILLTQLTGGDGDDTLVGDASGLHGRGFVRWIENGGAETITSRC
ncbi:MAG: beta-lactamase family protein [Planctomycetales bacterium]|nr:beta-lactamase family protein [Planctomycetales bacterium]